MGRAVLFSAQFLGAPRAEFGESLAQIRLTSERPRPGRLGLLGEIQAQTQQSKF